MIRFVSFLVTVLLNLSVSSPMIGSPSGDKLKQIGDEFKEALKFADAQLWTQAEEKARQTKKSIAVDIVKWLKLRNGTKNFSEYQMFLEINSDWPGIKLLRAKGELSINDKVSGAQIKAFFVNSEPLTGHGALRLARVFLAEGEYSRAQNIISKSWLTTSYSEKDLMTASKIFKNTLVKLHFNRADNLLWLGRLDEAKQMLPFLKPNFRELVVARIALQEKRQGVDSLINNLPKNLQNDPGLMHDRLAFRMAKGLSESAQRLLLTQSVSTDSLKKPASWASKREVLARTALYIGQSKEAYRLASKHFISLSDFGFADELAELEWLAGFIALEFLKNPENALFHFKNFAMFVQNPINKARAGYWIGRAYEGLSQIDNARKAYSGGAKFQTYFYGQLSAERGQFSPDRLLAQSFNRVEWEVEDFAQSSSVQAAILLFYAGRLVLSDRFFNHASETLSKSDRLKLSQLALDLGLMHSGISISKTAAGSGIYIPNYCFPLMDQNYFSEKSLMALSTAIIRQESGFFNNAQSAAGAIGLMQLMPRTAKAVASSMGLPFNPDRLASDKKYNIMLGGKFLKKLIKQFDGNEILAVAAYNAGAGRVRDWMKRFGDPRSPEVDPLIWIELIPFSETRNYVKRVIAADAVYRAKYTGQNISFTRLKKNLGY